MDHESGARRRCRGLPSIMVWRSISVDLSDNPFGRSMTTTFSAHNILLEDGTLTMPDCGWTIAESPWMLSARRVLDVAFPDGLAAKRIADLGCLEGGYTAEFARMGMDAIGVEVRESNFLNCEFVRSSLNLPNLAFIHDDVWNMSSIGKVDAIFCCGLLYHLDRPREFINLMANAATDVVIINTHYATAERQEKFNLGDLQEHEGVLGRWYNEHDTEDIQLLDTFKWTSWSNKRSFWLTKQAILDSLRQAGFDLVFEQFDWLGDDLIGSMTDGYYKTDCRGQFVGIRSRDGRPASM
jgi:2-polyprenyl-3-methyl-5-hydroxy-6-metoxy-1,4-benzoquinol methylase